MKITVLHSGLQNHAVCYACKTARRIARAGYELHFFDMLDYPPEFIHREEFLLIVSASLLNGEANENAESLWVYLTDPTRHHHLDRLEYSVLAVGQFALPYSFNCGLDFHCHLQRHGARLGSPSLALDLTAPFHFHEWLNRVENHLSEKNLANDLLSDERKS